MLHLEIHVLETEEDLDLALQSGLLTISQVNGTECSDCGTELGYASLDGFESFAVIINEHDQDWHVCTECAAPVIEGPGSFHETSYEDLQDLEVADPVEDLDYF